MNEKAQEVHACTMLNQWWPKYILPALQALSDQYSWNLTQESRLLSDHWSLSRECDLHTIYKNVFESIFEQHSQCAKVHRKIFNDERAEDFCVHLKKLSCPVECYVSDWYKVTMLVRQKTSVLY